MIKCIEVFQLSGNIYPNIFEYSHVFILNFLKNYGN